MTVAFTAQAGIASASGLPEWTPLVFGLVSVLVVLLVILLARRKMNESQRWRSGTDSGAGDSGAACPGGTTGPGDEPRRNDGA